MRRMLRIALLASVSLLAMNRAALADPFSVGVALVGAFTSITGVTVPIDIALIGQIALGALAVGANLLSASLFSGHQTLVPDKYQSNFTASDGSELRGVGRGLLGGLEVYGNTSGVNRYRMIAHMKGEIDGVEDVYLGYRPVTVEADGAVSSPPWSKPVGSYVYLRRQPGDGTETADANAVADLSEWTTAHKGQGIFQTTAQFISPGITTAKFQTLFQSGVPEVAYLARLEPVYDPRTLATAWTDNGILNTAHVLAQFPGFSAASFDWTTIGTEATRADAMVAKQGGTRKRATAHGIWASENKRVEIAQAFVSSIGGDVREANDGTIQVVLVDDAPTAERTFPADYIYDYDYIYGAEATDRANKCRVWYWSPERYYKIIDIDMSGIAWATIDDEVTRVGDIYYDARFPYCTDAGQAQQLARREFLLKRADHGLIVTNQAGAALWDISFADIEFPEFNADGSSETMLCLIGTPRMNDEDGTVEIPFTVWPQELIDEPWTPATHEAAAPSQLPPRQFEAKLDQPAAPSEAAVVQYPGGGAYETRVKFAGVTGGTVAEANYRGYTAGNPDSWASMSDVEGAGTFWLGYVAAGDMTGDQADFRVRFFNAEEQGSYFSDLLEVGALAVDNSTPPAPDVTIVTAFNGSNWEDTITTDTSDIAPVEVEITGSGGASGYSYSGDIRPGEPDVQVSSDAGYTNPTGRSYSVVVKTTDGTSSSATVVNSYNPTPPGP
ncbi:MAG: hypothetical protein K8H74_17835 [Notoacmeibacter sp.]|nr:hypothetical protein [Notoacmeibacter sp.]